jgi:uncharacterized protein (DUF1330 family)
MANAAFAYWSAPCSLGRLRLQAANPHLEEEYMKTHYAIALSVLTAIGGAATVQGLHAQGKPPVYFVTEMEVANPDAYGTDYQPKALASIKAAGGRQLAVGGSGGGGAKTLTAIEGNPPKRVVIHVWDSLEKLQAWRNGDDYKEARKIGDKHATFRSFAIEGLSQ